MPAAEACDIEGLYRKHRAGLVRLVERELHDRDDAEDIVQTAFLDAQRALERGTIPHNPPAWLAAIALNAARRMRCRQVSVDALEDYATQQASRLPEIKAALAGLPRHEQTAVLYRDVLGLSYAEMAERMGRTVPAVTMLLHRARLRLRSLLGITLVGGGLWRWLRSNEWEAAAANTAGAVVVAGGLATAGLVAGGHIARATGPVAPGRTAAAVQQRQESRREFVSAGTNVRVAGKRPARKARSSGAGGGNERSSAAGASSPATAPTSASQPLAAQPTAVSHPAASSPPSVPLPRLSTPQLPAPLSNAPAPTPLAAVATVTTAVAAAAGAVTSGTTQTVTTPVATVTVSVP